MLEAQQKFAQLFASRYDGSGCDRQLLYRIFLIRGRTHTEKRRIRFTPWQPRLSSRDACARKLRRKSAGLCHDCARCIIRPSQPAEHGHDYERDHGRTDRADAGPYASSRIEREHRPAVHILSASGTGDDRDGNFGGDGGDNSRNEMTFYALLALKTSGDAQASTYRRGAFRE